MLEAVSMIGEACYEGTTITWERAVKKVPFHLRIKLNDAPSNSAIDFIVGKSNQSYNKVNDWPTRGVPDDVLTSRELFQGILLTSWNNSKKS
jgi:hypothetical protein